MICLIYQVEALVCLLGYEYREESFADMRDPRLNGTISWTNPWGETYPFVSAVANSSPTPNSSGEREVTSLFAEMLLPILDNLKCSASH